MQKAQADWKVELIRNWPTIIGSLSDKVTLENVNEHTVILGVTNSSWLQELYLLSPMLRDTINKHLDKPRIKNIRFKNTSIETKKIYKKTTRKRDIYSRAVLISKRENDTLDHITDPELRAALKQFLIRCYQEKA